MMDEGCASFGHEHSQATRPCVWLALRRLDWHSLSRQARGEVTAVLRAKLPPGRPELAWPQGRNEHKEWLELAFAETHLHRCHWAPARPAQRPRPLPRTATNASRAAAFAASACGPVGRFETGALPFRWLPGLPVPRRSPPALAEGEALVRRRLEVMHVADYWPGPVWLYHAPGSGVWWDPGPRRVVARNLVDAILRFHPMASVVRHIEAIGAGDNRLARFRSYLQWRVAFGQQPWEAVLAGAAAGNASYEAFASAGELLAVLLTESPPPNVSSILLTRQMHFWPRGRAFDDADHSFALAMARPCAAERAHVEARTHFVAEMIDFRARRGDKHGKHGYAWRSTRDVPTPLYAHLSSQEALAAPCNRGRRAGALCTSCTPASLTRVLCRCVAAPGVHKTLSQPTFDAAASRACCLAGAARLWRARAGQGPG